MDLQKIPTSKACLNCNYATWAPHIPDSLEDFITTNTLVLSQAGTLPN